MTHTFTQLAIPPNPVNSVGNRKAVVGRLDVTAYVTGGIDLTNTGGLGKVYYVVPIDAINQNGAAAHFPRNGNPGFLQLFTAAGVEVANGADGGDLLVELVGGA